MQVKAQQVSKLVLWVVSFLAIRVQSRARMDMYIVSEPKIVVGAVEQFYVWIAVLHH